MAGARHIALLNLTQPVSIIYALLVPLLFYRENGECRGIRMRFSRAQLARTSAEKTTADLNQRNRLEPEKLCARQERGLGREDYPGEIRIPSREATSLPRAHAIRGVARHRYQPIRRREVSFPISSAACASPIEITRVVVQVVGSC